MELFVVLQRNRDSPGFYFLHSFESFHFPQGLKLFVHFRTQQSQYFRIWILSMISERPEIHHSPHTVPAQQSVNDVHNLCQRHSSETVGSAYMQLRVRSMQE